VEPLGEGVVEHYGLVGPLDSIGDDHAFWVTIESENVSDLAETGRYLKGHAERVLHR
jgi:hypothetical protein